MNFEDYSDEEIYDDFNKALSNYDYDDLYYEKKDRDEDLYG